MKIALICPSNMLFMPYVTQYLQTFREQHADCTVLNWDRFGMEQASETTYRDKKTGHQRKAADYYSYRRFVVRKLKEEDFDKVVVFGVQMAFFLGRYLRRHFHQEFMVDIRDYNRLLKHFSIEKIIRASAYTVVSSPSYLQWLPDSDHYLVSHNMDRAEAVPLESALPGTDKGRIRIACIGALRDLEANLAFIKEVMYDEKITLSYHGEGEINHRLEQYLEINHVRNVALTGRYQRQEEKELYLKSGMINVLRYNDSISNRTALPNRLYRAALWGKPLLALEGTYLGQVIEKYHLGLVLDSLNGAGGKIVSYWEDFDRRAYEAGRQEFLKQIQIENEAFIGSLKCFAKSRPRSA